LRFRKSAFDGLNSRLLTKTGCTTINAAKKVQKHTLLQNIENFSPNIVTIFGVNGKMTPLAM
jgi:hypothetical protein